MQRTLCIAAIVLGLVTAAAAQGPAAQWRTIQTAHFRVHYPAEYEAWSRHVTARLEPVRDAVIGAIGYAPPQTIDVIIINPLATANGQALTLLDTPRLVLWADSPEPEGEIGNFTDWGDLLTTHEVTHLVHLLRPSRNPTRRIVERLLLPIGPIALSAPRWVLEGYATVIEGRITGSGRPNGAFRAAVLRRWAVAGRLPGYSALASDSRDFLGMSMAYLGGSAYLEWLERRAGPDSLRKLWARMTARQTRSFEGAFEGVFGHSPQELYGRFRAELTAEAMREESALEGEPRGGELWQQTRWRTGTPAVSPDGSRMAFIERARKKKPKLLIVEIAPNGAEGKKREERRRKLLAKDPEDVPAIESKPIPHKVLATLILPDGGDFESPRWMPGGKSLLFTHRVPDREGFLHNELFQWDGQGVAERITALADVRDPDVLPDGRTAVGVRSRYGRTDLVRIDLRSGALTEIVRAERALVAGPRVSPDGRRLAFVQHRGGSWQLVVRNFAGGDEVATSFPPNVAVAQPAWSRHGDAIYASVQADRSIELVRFAVAPTALQAEWITRTIGAAFAPEPAPDGSLFFLSLEPDGLAIRRLADPSALAEVSSRHAATAAPDRSPESSDLPERRYGFGRQELSGLLSGSETPTGRSLEMGVRSGDLLGRFDVFAVAARGSGTAPGGITAGAAWRGWPVRASVQWFDTRERPSHQSRAVVDRSFDLDRRGVVLTGDWSARFALSRLSMAGGVLAGSLRGVDDGGWKNRRVVFAQGGWDYSRILGEELRFSPSARVASERGTTSGDAWRHQRGSVELSVRAGDSELCAGYDRDWLSGAAQAADRLVLGGAQATVLPPAAISTRIFEPALPVGTLVGDSHSAKRLSLRTPIVPGRLFYVRHEIRADGGGRSTVSLAGVRFDLKAEEGVPLLKILPFDATIGLARILDDPLKGKTSFWFALTWRP